MLVWVSVVLVMGNVLPLQPSYSDPVGKMSRGGFPWPAFVQHPQTSLGEVSSNYQPPLQELARLG